MRARLNRALLDVKPSAIRAFGALAKQTPGCLSLTLGEPDFDTPASVREAAKRALDCGETHYIENVGSAALRRAISAFEQEKDGLHYAPDEIVVTSGATEAIFTALFSILEPGDEVIVPMPAFVLYESVIALCRAKLVPLYVAGDGFQIREKALREKVTDRTKAIILNSPNNPTGAVLDAESLEAVRRVTEENEIFVLCDDVYRQLVYEGEYHSFAEVCRQREKCLVVQSYSKPYAMTGWRMGYLMGDASIIDQMKKVHQFTVVSTASFSQDACIEALRCDPTPMVETYRKRRAYMLGRLEEMGLECIPPAGAFYLFPSIEKYGMDSTTFCTRLVREGLLAATPGACFGADTHMRLTYCYEDAVLAEGMNRLEAFLRTL